MTEEPKPSAAAHGSIPNGRYPRGFYFGSNPPTDFQASRFQGLFLDATGPRSYAAVGEAEVAVVGSCVDVRGFDREEPATRLARELAKSADAFFAALDHQAGRHAVFFRSPLSEGVLGDATGCRTIFYHQDAIASHTALLTDAQRESVPFAMGFPGNWTPIPGIRILTPNTLLDLSTRRVSRFWPRHSIQEVDLEGAQTTIEAYARNAFRNGPLALGLTAGIDSRTLAVSAYKAGADLLTYTYDRGPQCHNDIAVAQLVADRLGFEHVTVTARPPSGEMRTRLRGATYYNHHFNCVEPMAEALGGRAVATGNLLEIGRVFYGRHRRHGRDLSTPEQMAAHFFANSRRTAQINIEKFGHDRWTTMATKAFGEFNTETDFQSAAKLMDPFDLFYWEHRMGTWQSLILLERDFYGEPYMPFNCRAIFTAMLGLPRGLREDASLFLRLTGIPELAGVPITSSSTAAISSAPGKTQDESQVENDVRANSHPRPRGLRSLLARLLSHRS